MKYDRHHLFHSRQEWELRPEAKWLRERPEFIPFISRVLHDDIHRQTPAVPTLPYDTLLRTVKFYRPDIDTIRAIDNVAWAIDKASEHHKTHPVELEVGHLAVEVLLQQRDLLRGNLTEAVA